MKQDKDISKLPMAEILEMANQKDDEMVRRKQLEKDIRRIFKICQSHVDDVPKKHTSEDSQSAVWEKIVELYGLNTDEEKKRFLLVFSQSSSIEYYQKMKHTMFQTSQV